MGDKINVTIPTIGESISEGTIGRWFFSEGDIVKKDQPLLEVDSDKATLEVPAPASGRLTISVPAGTTTAVGSLVGMIEVVNGGTAVAGAPAPSSSPAVSAQPSKSVETATGATTPSSPSAPATASKPVSSIGAEQLKGLGPSKRRAVRSGTMPAPGTQQAPAPWSNADGEVVRKPMSTLRKKIAQRLLDSQQSTATLTTFNEVDMTNVMGTRAQLKDEFQKRFDVKLGFMSYFARAIIAAMKDYPDVNARIEGDDVVYPQNVNLGIAVSTDRGLVVPVLKNAQSLSYSEIEKRIADLADRARSAKLSIPEMQGGTFTLTNGGIFGSLLSTPILNPPQSGILGMHKIEMRPRAIENNGKWTVEVRPMMYLALSYDHRLIDGVTSVGFLVKVKEYLEKVTRDEVLAG